MDKIILSVVIISYNQEKYIRNAIDSVLMQKVNFKYELILADDCSPDNTKKILEEYEKKYPNIIKIAKRNKNMGSTKNILNAGKISKGKYITTLEGDDYWSDKNKLQMQVDFLENNSNYIGVAHLQEGRNLDDKPLGIFPSWIKKDIDVNMSYFEEGKDFSLSTCLYKNIYKEKKYQDELEYLLSLHRIVGDLQLCYFLLEHGIIHIINKPMMIYRVIKKDGESNYNSNNSASNINLTNMIILRKIDDSSNNKYNFFVRYCNCITMGFCLNLLTFKLSAIGNFFKYCPKKYKVKIAMLIPYYTIKIVLNRRK